MRGIARHHGVRRVFVLVVCWSSLSFTTGFWQPSALPVWRQPAGVSLSALNVVKEEPLGRLGNPRVLIVGGSGRIGTAAAAHLLSTRTKDPLEVVLAGRGAYKGAQAMEEVLKMVGGSEYLRNRGSSLSFEQLDYEDENMLSSSLVSGKFDVVIHTAGPYLKKQPSVLEACIQNNVPCYVDVADPTSYITAALSLGDRAKISGTCGLVCGGAFPGLSNLLAMEAASLLSEDDEAGLGGSGAINLYITNLGFGEPVEIFKSGKLEPEKNAGLDVRRVSFFIDPSDVSFKRIGEVTTWAWPFPEGRTVAEQLAISGKSRVAMGTAPELWNVVMGILVKVVPRDLWTNEFFSMGMAKFSEPMVRATDKFVGETHAIRVDVKGASGQRTVALQAHDSFRTCVGQSCAEFALDLLRRHAQGMTRPGVYLPEEMYKDRAGRKTILDRAKGMKECFTFRVQKV